MQARIVSNDEQHVRVPRLANNTYEFIAPGIVDPFLLHDLRRFGEGLGNQRPGFLRACCRRNEGKVGHQAVAGHVGADKRRVLAAALGQPAIAVALAGFGAFRLGVTQQQQSAHGDNVVIWRL
jgi:hypothetical protein